MRQDWNPIWIYAAAGSIGLHLLAACGLLLSGSDMLGWLRLETLRAASGKTVALGFTANLPGESAATGELPEGFSSQEVKERLAEELDATRQMTEPELRQKLDEKRTALEKIPEKHVGQITNVLEKLLPTTTYTLETRTNHLGEPEYVLSFTNASGQKEEFVFDEEDRKEGGFLQLLEDPLFGPLMRFAIPLAGDTNATPKK